MTTDNQEFSPGEKVFLIHKGPSCYPPAPCTIIKKMVDTLEECPTCGHLWHGFSGPNYWKKHPSYSIRYATGAEQIVSVERLKKMDYEGQA